MIVTAYIKFSLHTSFLDTMLQAEDERLPGESVEDGVIRVHKALEQARDKIKKAHEIDLGFGPGIHPPTNPDYSPRPQMVPQVINYQQKDALEIAIDNATSLSDLSGIKDRCFENGLSQQYIMKFNELNNAGTGDFSAGLE
jgi:hypothetical protein